MLDMTPFSHVAPILPTDVEQRIGDLAERGDLDGLHQFLKHVPDLACNLELTIGVNALSERVSGRIR